MAGVMLLPPRRLAWVSAAFFLAAATGSLFPSSASAADDTALFPSVAAPSLEVSGLTLKFGGFATGTAYKAHASGGPLKGASDDSDVTGQVRANTSLERTLDNGIQLGVHANFLVAHGTLSDDRYGNDTVQRVYVYGRMAYGTLELGQQDGVGVQLGLTGPRLDPRVSLDDPDTTFFVDPSTQKRFDRFFRPFSAMASSSNAAKINYLSPRLFGLQLGVSFTPSMVKSPMPFLGNPSDGPDRQKSMWETAVNYSTFFGNLGIGASVAYLHGSLDNGTPGHDDLDDLAIGGQATYMLSDMKLSLGGGYRWSNAYGFRPGEVFSNGNTKLGHASFMVEEGPMRASVEYSDGDIDGPVGLPDYTMEAYQAALGYKINDNLDVGAGWQWYTYDRSLGVFYNGSKSIDMDAGFLSVNFGL